MTSEVRTWSKINRTHNEADNDRLDDGSGDRADQPLDQRSAVVERHDPDAAAAGRSEARGSSP